MAINLRIPIPVIDQLNWWMGTTGVKCPCGGTIEWAEAGYAPGFRACRNCLLLYKVREDGNHGQDRVLVAQTVSDQGILVDAHEGTNSRDLYRVPSDLYPNWHQPVAKTENPQSS